MTPGPANEHAGEEKAPQESTSQRRRRRDRVFGEVLPEATVDDLPDAGGEPVADTDGTDEWLRRQVPPHHG